MCQFRLQLDRPLQLACRARFVLQRGELIKSVGAAIDQQSTQSQRAGQDSHTDTLLSAPLFCLELLQLLHDARALWREKRPA
jgi:hypothetical protein